MGQQFDQLGRIRLVHPGIQQGIAMGDRHSAGVFCQIRNLCRSLGSKKAEIDRKAHRNHKQQTHSQFDSVLQFHGHVRQPFLWFIRSKKLPLAGENSSLIQPGPDRGCPAGLSSFPCPFTGPGKTECPLSQAASGSLVQRGSGTQERPLRNCKNQSAAVRLFHRFIWKMV